MKTVFSRGVFLIIAGILVVAILVFHLLFVEHKNETHDLLYRQFASEVRPDRNARRTPIVRIVERVMPSVVNINTKKPVPQAETPWDHFFEKDDFINDETSLHEDGKTLSLGSGSILDSTGLVLTNAHVIYRAQEINITLWDRRVYRAEAVASDYANDIALLRILDPPAHLKEIVPAAINDLMIGETVVAVGNPYGLDSSVTVGVLSATKRRFIRGSKVLFSDILQTDMGIYPGSSGGPLLNLDGQMIGMNMSYLPLASKIGFAIPLIQIENTLAKWMLPEQFHSLFFGIIPQVRQTQDGRREVYLASVFPGSPAERAGLKAGDVLDSIDGVRSLNLPTVFRQMIRFSEPRIVNVRIAGSTANFPVQLVPMPPLNGIILAKQKLGLSVQPLTPQMAKALNYPFEKGVILDDQPDMEGITIKRGDLLISVNGHSLSTVEELATILEKCASGTKVDLEFLNINSSANGPVSVLKRYARMTVR